MAGADYWDNEPIGVIDYRGLKYCGFDEVYVPWFECKCGFNEVSEDAKYCSACGREFMDKEG